MRVPLETAAETVLSLIPALVLFVQKTYFLPQVRVALADFGRNGVKMGGLLHTALLLLDEPCF